MCLLMSIIIINVIMMCCIMMLRRWRLRLLQPRILAAPARPGEYYRDRPVARAGDAALNSCCSRQAA